MSRFKKVTADELIEMLRKYNYRYSQIHHTWRPNHADFNGSNHISMQEGMWRYHTKTNGWSDIGQHVSLFPDGMFVTGRPLSMTPAGIAGYNTGAFMTEIIGDFDIGKDKLTGAQLYAILKVNHYLIGRGTRIMFHREHAPKTCPGTGIDRLWFIGQVQNFKPTAKPIATYQPAPVHVEKAKQEALRKPTITVLGFGDKGAQVKQLQTDLKALGYDIGKYGADGLFGRDTKDAVMRFQAAHGLVVDGLAGPATLGKIASLPKGKTTPSKSNVKVDGYLGPETISAMQRYFGTPVDGVISRPSLVVKELQKLVGVKQDGILGPQTISAMQKRFGTPVDGKISKPSVVIKELQRRLNNGKL